MPAPAIEQPPTIRLWNRTDSLPDLLALLHGAFGALPIEPRSSVLNETLADLAARASAQTIFIAVVQARLAGSVFCERQGDDLYVARLAVAPPYRRRGIASALLKAARRQGLELGCARLTLQVRIALAENVAFFQRHGFAIVGSSRHPGFAEPTSYEMALPLR